MTRYDSFPARPGVAALLAVLACLSVRAAGASTDPHWVVLDDTQHRQGDAASIQRDGPWVRFTQRWGEQNGKLAEEPIVEQMAVNCLTGAYGQTRYPATDPHSGKRIEKRQSLSEIEHSQTFEDRLLLEENATDLGRSLVAFACPCEASAAGQAPTPAEMQRTYARYIAEPLSQVEYHVRFLRVKSRQIAERAIAELATEPFATVFDRYASPADARSFPHGELGAQLETEFPIDEARRLRSLRIGEASRVPHEGLYGWEVEQLDSRRTLPAPTLASMQPRLRQYLTRAHGCGWAP